MSAVLAPPGRNSTLNLAILENSRFEMDPNYTFKQLDRGKEQRDYGKLLLEKVVLSEILDD